jgi:hypothetical protein
MGTVNASFCNGYGDSRLFVIWDLKRDPNYPPEVFRGYLDPSQCTDSLSLYTGDDMWGKVAYQRSDGAQTIVDTVTEGSTVNME